MAATKSPAVSPIEERDSWEERYAQSGFFNISSMAQKRIMDKRRRKGLGEIRPREKSVYGQLYMYTVTLSAVKTIGAPLERMRIILQTRHMQNVKTTERPGASSIALFQSKP
jgi:hypothetical protein